MDIIKHYKGLLLSLLMYLPTCAFMPSWIYLLLILCSVYLNVDFLKGYFSDLFKLTIRDNTFSFLLLFAFLALIFRIIDIPNWEGLKDLYSFAYLFPFTYIVARSVKQEEIKIINYLLIFISIEAVFSALEYVFGVSTFFTSLKLFREFDNYKTLYYTRVFGLSENSSGLSLKLFIGIILLNLSTFKKWTKIILEFLFLMASVLVFGRIVLLIIPIYYILKIIHSVLNKTKLSKENLAPFIVFSIVFIISPNWTKNQFTRYDMAVATTSHHDLVSIDTVLVNTNVTLNGNNTLNSEKNKISNSNSHVNEDTNKDLTSMIGVNKINMAGRNRIWNDFFEFGKNNLIFGNFGKKYLLNGKTHAHNSYLEMFASFGLIMILFFISIFIFKINTKNFYIIIPLFMLGFGQYFIFWGISFFDIIFYYLIFFNRRVLNEK